MVGLDGGTGGLAGGAGAMGTTVAAVDSAAAAAAACVAPDLTGGGTVVGRRVAGRGGAVVPIGTADAAAADRLVDLVPLG